jgi:hypothetical protein
LEELLEESGDPIILLEGILEERRPWTMGNILQASGKVRATALKKPVSVYLTTVATCVDTRAENTSTALQALST